MFKVFHRLDCDRIMVLCNFFAIVWMMSSVVLFLICVEGIPFFFFFFFRLHFVDDFRFEAVGLLRWMQDGPSKR